MLCDIAQNFNLKNLTQGYTRNTMTLKHVKSAQHNVSNLPSQKQTPAPILCLPLSNSPLLFCPKQIHPKKCYSLTSDRVTANECP